MTDLQKTIYKKMKAIIELMNRLSQDEIFQNFSDAQIRDLGNLRWTLSWYIDVTEGKDRAYIDGAWMYDLNLDISRNKSLAKDMEYCNEILTKYNLIEKFNTLLNKS